MEDVGHRGMSVQLPGQRDLHRRVDHQQANAIGDAQKPAPFDLEVKFENRMVRREALQFVLREHLGVILPHRHAEVAAIAGSLGENHAALVDEFPQRLQVLIGEFRGGGAGDVEDWGVVPLRHRHAYVDNLPVDLPFEGPRNPSCQVGKVSRPAVNDSKIYNLRQAKNQTNRL